MKTQFPGTCVLVTALAATLLVSCGKPAPDLAPRIAELEEQMKQQRESAEQQLAGLNAELDAARMHNASADSQVAEQKAEVDKLRGELESKNAQILALTQTVEKARAYFEQQKQRRSAAPAVPQPVDARTADFIHAPVGSQPDLFPVYVYDISSKKVKTGTHTELEEKRSIVTGYYGTSTEYESEQVTDFGYQVVFSVNNQTKSVKNVIVDAGDGARTIAVPAAGSLKSQAISAIKGAPLTVTAAGESRSFNVTYNP